MGIVDCEGKSTRDINVAIKGLMADGETEICVRHPAARHNLAVALTVPVRVIVEGSVGYYCGGMGDGPTIAAHGSAGWGLAEGMMSGTVNSAPSPYCPRTVLSRYLDRVRREWGYTYKIGIEPEFHLLQQDGDGHWRVYDKLDTLAKPCYDLRALHRNLDIMTTLIKYMQEMGWDPYANDHEDANCQFEINFTYADALTTADRHTFFKWMVKTVAEQHGLLATFMPKPFAHLTGNGAHFHMSLWDAEKDVNLFDDQQDELGLSQLAYHFCGGLMKHAKAPVCVTYGGSNRTQMIHIPGPGRLENRIVDGAANPYLAATVLLAAGLDGVQNKLDPGPKNTRNLYEVPEAVLHKDGIEFLPTTLKDALDHFAADEVVRKALGPEYAEMYLRVKREE